MLSFISAIGEVGLAAGALSACLAALSAARSWYEKSQTEQRTRRERRATQIEALLARFKPLRSTFDEVFDYSGPADAALRLVNLRFTLEEQEMRSKADAAFEFLRDVHRSVRLGLIEPDDLDPWIYWIHRTAGSKSVAEYARACGYGSFLTELRAWTVASPQLDELRRHCPWWHERDAAHSLTPTPRQTVS